MSRFELNNFRTPKHVSLLLLQRRNEKYLLPHLLATHFPRDKLFISWKLPGNSSFKRYKKNLPSQPSSLSKNSKKRENYFCTSLVYIHTHASFHRKERMFETRPNWHVYRVINRAHPSPASPCASIQANAKNGRWFDPVGSPMTPAALSAQPSPGAGNCDLTFARRQCQPTTLALPEWDAALAADRCNRATPDRENWIRTGSHVFSRFRCTRNPRGSRGS